MQSTSSLYQQIIQEAGHYFEVKLNINGIDYGEDVIFGAKSETRIFDTEPTIGGTYCSTFEFSLLGDGSEIPKMAVVIPYFRAVGASSQSEWLQKGIYYIDTRSVSENSNGVKVFTAFCYDPILKANAPYSTTSLTWPARDIDVVNEIASAIGVTVASLTTSFMLYGYTIQLPTQYTYRDVLGFIAAMYCGNWVINDVGKLELVRLNFNYLETNIGGNVTTLNVSPTRPAYTKVVFVVDDETEVSSGSTDDHVMEATCPYATQAMADRVYNTLSTYTYKPFEALGCWINPAIECKDGVSTTDFSGLFIATRTIYFGRGMVMDITAPNDNYIDHEYKYESPTERQYRRTIAGINNSITLNSEGISIVSEKLDNIGGTNLIINTFDTASLPQDASGYIELDSCPRLVGQPHNSLNNYWLCTPVTHGVKMNRTNNASTSILNYTFGSTDSTRDYFGMQGLTAGETYTFSADMNWRLLTSATTTQTYVTVRLRWFDSNNNSTRVYAWQHPITPATEQSARAVATFTIPLEAVAIAVQIIVIFEGGTSAPDASAYPVGDWLQMENMKMEVGAVATAWSAAPQDFVGNDQIISKINVSPESIVIAANKVDLQGFVKFTNLSTSGQTTINGANIVTGLIQDAQGKNSWNLDTGALTITNGTINITTDPGSTDYIRLNWFNNDQTSMRILELYPGDSSLYGYGRIRMGVRGYNALSPDNYTLTFAEISHNWQGMTYAQEVYVNGSVSSRKTIAQCTANAVSGYWGSLTDTGLVFLDQLDPGTVTATYPATGLQKLTGAVDNTTATGCVYAVPPQTFSSASTQQAAAEALLKYICTNYPNKTSCTFIGNYITTANRRGYEFYISSTSTVNANGIPQYASGIVYEASTTMMVYSVNVSNYVTYLSYNLPRIGTAETSDLNNCTENGIYEYSSAAANNPTGTGGMMLSTKYSSTYGAQLLFSNIAANNGARLYYRRKNANGWQPYYGVMTLKRQSGTDPYNESVIDYVANSGTTRTYTLVTAHTYLVTVARRNTTTTDKDGLWICAVHSTNSHLTAVKSPGVTYTISVSSTTLSITTWDNYMNISILDLGGY